MGLHKIKSVSRKSIHALRTDGPIGFAKRGSRYVYYRQFPEKRQKKYKDILFINGCALPHPERYRVHHQIEQLEAAGMSADSVFYERLDLEMLKNYRGFIFFRCPVTDTIREFIKLAKQYNKTCFYDVDDLVIDQKYTDQIEYVQNMAEPDKRLYDDGVDRMRETLKLCDYAITTTDRLQQELKKYTKEVFINRNVASDEMVAHSLAALKEVKRDDSKVVIGYFSGSITHNEDFEMVLPSLIKLMEKYKNLYLKVAGILDIPASLEPYRNRIINVAFMDWREMPREIASCDITIAPLTNNIFNEAKSENKWTEASLVKVATVASNIGAFKKVVKANETGLLVDKPDDWYVALEELITNKEKRESIALQAYKDVLKNHTTIPESQHLANYIKSRLARNIAFILPSTDISGGVNVVLKHAEILQKNGWDVTLIDAMDKDYIKKAQKQYGYRLAIPGYNVITQYKTDINAHFDTMVATLWTTTEFLRKYPNAKNKLYFVQSFETDFYIPGATEARLLANSTYCDSTNIRYITMSLWCKDWLKKKFNKDAEYCSNGIDLKNYTFKQKDFTNKKLKILIEGDSKDEYKNTDEAFRIANELDPDKFEIVYLSYRKEPKDWYKVDQFYSRIAPEEVGKVYASCDILVKTSILESFSYPPLEMMATGGVSVVVPNEGNIEYLKDGENCLFYRQGDIADGIAKIELLVKDAELRNKLIKQGRETAEKYQWDNIEKDILKLYR